MAIFAVELAHVKSIGVIRNTGYVPRESSTEVTSGCSNRGVSGGGRSHKVTTELYV